MASNRRADMINNAIRIPSSLQGSFFRKWIEFLTPLHGLTKREQDVLAAFIKARFELSKVIKDDALLDKVVMSDDIKEKVKEECGVSNAFFQVIYGKLKKTGIIQDNKINPKWIPKKLNETDNSFLLLAYFDLDARNN